MMGLVSVRTGNKKEKYNLNFVTFRARAMSSVAPLPCAHINALHPTKCCTLQWDMSSASCITAIVENLGIYK